MNVLFVAHDWLTEGMSKYKRGIGVICVLVFIGWIVQKQSDARKQELDVIDSPMVHDVYIVDAGKLTPDVNYQQQFKIYQVTEVKDDRVTFKVGRYSYNKYRDIKRGIQLNQLMIDGYFSAMPETWTTKELLANFDSGALYEAHRPVDIFVMGGIVRQRPRLALSYHTDKPNQNNQRAIRFYQTGELEQARLAFEEAANEGDSWGQFNLAEMLRDGSGGKQDVERALYWFNKARQQGLERANTAYKNLCAATVGCSN